MFLFLFLLFRATPAAYGGGSQARGRTGATAPGLGQSHRKPDLSRVCNLHYSSRQCWIHNPLSEATDQTCNLMIPSRIRFCCATMGTLNLEILKKKKILLGSPHWIAHKTNLSCNFGLVPYLLWLLVTLTAQ